MATKTYHHGDLRNALLDAAESVLAQRGVEGFSLRACAKEAGVSHAAPAHHFKDVSGLLTAVAARGFEQLTSAMEKERDAAEQTAMARFKATGVAYIEFANRSPMTFRLMFGAERPDSDDPTLFKRSEEAFAVLVNEVAGNRGDAPLTSEAGRLDVASAWAIVHGIAHLSLAGRLFFVLCGSEAEKRAAIEAMVERALA